MQYQNYGPGIHAHGKQGRVQLHACMGRALMYFWECLTMHECGLFLTLGACANEGYSSWVCLCVCVCVCLSGENKLLRSLTPVICSAYSIYMTNSRFKTCGIR